MGHSIGDEFDVNVTFPEDYHAEELKGKPAVFKIKLHEIKVKELPTVDDEFVKDVSEFDTLDEYKKDIEKRLQEQREKAADSDVGKTSWWRLSSRRFRPRSPMRWWGTRWMRSSTPLPTACSPRG